MGVRSFVSSSVFHFLVHVSKLVQFREGLDYLIKETVLVFIPFCSRVWFSVVFLFFWEILFCFFIFCLFYYICFYYSQLFVIFFNFERFSAFLNGSFYSFWRFSFSFIHYNHCIFPNLTFYLYVLAEDTNF